MKKNRKYASKIIGCWLAASLFWCCSSGLPGLPEDDGDDGDPGVTVRFSAGNSVARTRVPFADDTPLKLYMYEHPRVGPVDLSQLPCEVIDGIMWNDGSGSPFSNVVPAAGGDLRVKGGRTYTFVAFVMNDADRMASVPDDPVAGVLGKLGHGVDMLAAIKEDQIDRNTYGTKEIHFDGPGTDPDGNLLHLGSAVRVRGELDPRVIEFMKPDDTFSVEGIDFNGCLPAEASLSFIDNDTPLALTLSGEYTASRSFELPTVATPVADERVTSGDGYLLPYPGQRDGGSYNEMDIDFRLKVAGADVLISATGVEVPAFEPGYRYTFVVEFGFATTMLLLEATSWSWNPVDWGSDMGGGDKITFQLGAWKSVSWNSDMGGGDRIDIRIGNWVTHSWSTEMGGGDRIDIPAGDWQPDVWDAEMGGGDKIGIGIGDWTPHSWDSEMGEETPEN